MMRTLTDYFGSKKEVKKKTIGKKEGDGEAIGNKKDYDVVAEKKRDNKSCADDKAADVVSFDMADFPDSLHLLKNSLSMSLLTSRPFSIKNLDFLNERIISLVDCAKLLGDARVYYEKNILEFNPKKIDFMAKDFSNDHGVISEMVEVVLPVLLFSPRNSTVTFRGLTEYKISLDYFACSVVPFLQGYCEIETKIIERGFVSGKNGAVEIKLRPKFKFNKSVYDEKMTGTFGSIFAFLEHAKKNKKFIDADLLGSGYSCMGKKPVSIRCMINAPKKEMPRIEDEIKRPIDLILRNTKIPFNMKVEYSEIDASSASITLCLVSSVNSEIDYSKRNSFDILSKSIVINNLDKRNIEKLLAEIYGYCDDVLCGKTHYRSLEKSLAIYRFLFERLDPDDIEDGEIFRKFL